MPGDDIAHIAHLGGVLFGFFPILYWKWNLHHPQKKVNYERPRQPGYGSTREDDMEYNRQKQQRQAEVDAILDKIRKSGYDSLTKEEKQRLFEASRER